MSTDSIQRIDIAWLAPRIMLIVCVTGLIQIWAGMNGWLDWLGRPFGYDYITFWSAGRLTLAGTPALAFDADAILRIQQEAIPGTEIPYLWHYPPTFQLVSAVLALPPYAVSYIAAMALSIAAYVWALRPLMPGREPALWLLALPGTVMCVFHGQNSLLSTALIAGAILLLDRRPVAAGVLIGLLAYKPQLAALFPLALALTGRWVTFVSAGATAIAFAAVATLVLGLDLWRVFLDNTATVRHIMETRWLPWEKMPSAFSFLAMVGAPLGLAYAGQIAVALTAVAATLAAFLRCGATRPAFAVLVTATVLLSPYMFDYEMVLLAIPIAILARELIERGGTRLEWTVLALAAVSPTLTVRVALITGVQWGFLVVIALLWLATARALASARTASLPASAAA